jgi:tetrahydrodipicolinate N-succinyltransferase
MPFNKITLDTEFTTKIQNITSIYNSLESAISTLVDDSREKMWAITNLEQSYMWLQKAIEREQLERNFRSGQTLPEPQTQQHAQPIQQQEQLSPNAQILADSRERLDSLLSSIKEITDTVATKGFPIK